MSTDRDITVPDTVDGMAVVEIGPSFMSGSPASDGRTVTIPASVKKLVTYAFSGMLVIMIIDYGGTLDEFCSFGLLEEF